LSRIWLASGVVDAIAAWVQFLERALNLTSNRNPRFTRFRVAPKHELNFVDAEVVMVLQAPTSAELRS
jgi:hypothetical protein